MLASLDLQSRLSLSVRCCVQENGGAARKGAGGRKDAQSEAPWVMTGAGTEAQYSSARRDARDHMRMRNTFFQQVAARPSSHSHFGVWTLANAFSCTFAMPAL